MTDAERTKPISIFKAEADYIEEPAKVVRLETELAEARREINDLKTHAATSDFCSAEWKADRDELASLLIAAKEIISETVYGSREDEQRQKSWLDDVEAALAGKESPDGLAAKNK